MSNWSLSHLVSFILKMILDLCFFAVVSFSIKLIKVINLQTFDSEFYVKLKEAEFVQCSVKHGVSVVSNSVSTQFLCTVAASMW